MAKIQRQIETFKFAEFPGIEIKCWVSAPVAFVHELRFGGLDETETRRRLLEAFPEWNLEDDEGPIPHTVEGFDRWPSNLMSMCVLRFLAGGRLLSPDFGKAS